MNVTITPGLLRGAITPPPSKSQAHRLLIAAALADGESRIEHLADSQDIQATRRCMAALKAPGEDLPVLDCGESGSTLRFLIPVALALRGGGRFTGRGRLMARPQKPYFDLFDEKGIAYRQEDGVLTVQGRLTPGTFALPGDVSSQFVTGLLYALPLLEGDSRITLTTPLESRGYVDMTLEALERFGIRAECPDGRTLRVPGGQTYRPCRAAVESDYSQAAFYYAANGLGGQVEILGLNPRSAQGDRCIVPYHMQLCGPGEAELDVSQCPDLVPPLAAHAALRQGITRIVNAARLRIKESDRLTAVTQVLTALGADVVEGADRLTITGQPEGLAGGVTVDSHNDHRIAMMAAVAATRCAAPVTIIGAECVAKSYPDFWEDYERLGGQIQRS
ncbi:MAG: 3-phosphoshikimate 1-carboxyvinyltransferase [Intestinimonas massiliensis]|uniref:3-phosphoshikimate 1-carboxyvinyltransferase n=1 Tax=Intestinimonas massiliensis (ex Afouda et al. 2020) TaxID=1673721 RepID=UPI002432A756|nr:3-phosphoshikimate 1-carboxyvinyltransferase [Intestinimonas massiliensis (ex Afouda et al. 2020)]MCI5561640.1 3-phosphoshikimate 1-carboxyvinyltransferase [Intestinimonas massiliensis (ex Afouda et al. 2020)]